MPPDQDYGGQRGIAGSIKLGPYLNDSIDSLNFNKKEVAMQCNVKNLNILVAIVLTFSLGAFSVGCDNGGEEPYQPPPTQPPPQPTQPPQQPMQPQQENQRQKQQGNPANPNQDVDDALPEGQQGLQQFR